MSTSEKDKISFPAPLWISDVEKDYMEYKKIWHSFYAYRWQKARVSLSDQEKRLSVNLFKLLFGSAAYSDVTKHCRRGEVFFSDFEYRVAQISVDDGHDPAMRASWVKLSTVTILLCRQCCQLLYPADHKFSKDHPAKVMSSIVEFSALDEYIQDMRNSLVELPNKYDAQAEAESGKGGLQKKSDTVDEIAWPVSPGC